MHDIHKQMATYKSLKRNTYFVMCNVSKHGNKQTNSHSHTNSYNCFEAVNHTYTRRRLLLLSPLVAKRTIHPKRDSDSRDSTSSIDCYYNTLLFVLFCFVFAYTTLRYTVVI